MHYGRVGVFRIVGLDRQNEAMGGKCNDSRARGEIGEMERRPIGNRQHGSSRRRAILAEHPNWDNSSDFNGSV
jgi:hypothetical protein